MHGFTFLSSQLILVLADIGGEWNGMVERMLELVLAVPVCTSQ